MSMDRRITGEELARPQFLPMLKVSAGLFAGLVLVQALLAGRGWFRDRDLIAIHGGVGALVVLVAISQVVLTLLVGAPAHLRRSLGLCSAALLVLVVVQYALGFATRTSAEAAAWHVPNGVLLFGLAVINCMLIFRLRR